MTRQEIDSIIQNNTQEGVNSSPDFIDFPTLHSTGLGNGVPQASISSYNSPTSDDMKDIVRAMTDDTQWINGERWGEPTSRLTVGMLPTTQPREWDSKYPGEENVDFLYNNPQYKGMEDYFTDQGLTKWMDNSSLMSSPAGRDLISRLFNLAQGMNEYKEREDLKDFQHTINDKNLYGSTLAEMLGRSGESRSLVDEAREQAELQRQQEAKQALANRARQRDITGSGYGAIAW